MSKEQSTIIFKTTLTHGASERFLKRKHNWYKSELLSLIFKYLHVALNKIEDIKIMTGRQVSFPSTDGLSS